jgi:F-type H+-transporting ATPase subunit delta
LRAPTIARNYAEVLYTLGERSGRTEEYARLLDALAGAVETSPEAQAVLMSPKVTKARKAELLSAALPGSEAKELVHFLRAVVQRGRQLALSEIARQYAALVDVKHNRVRAGITLARTPDAELQAAISAALGKALGKEAVPTFTVEPEILGGVIVRVGDRVLDGSVRRKLAQLRRQLLAR